MSERGAYNNHGIMDTLVVKGSLTNHIRDLDTTKCLVLRKGDHSTHFRSPLGVDSDAL